MSWHASEDLLRRYADGDDTLPGDAVWAVEVHLESCAPCRALLAGQAAAVSGLLDRVWVDLAGAVAAEPAPVRQRSSSPLRRLLAGWASPVMVPWLLMTVVVTALALLGDLLVDGEFPSLVLLLAPVAPVAGVAAAWSRGLDPAHELVASASRAGLHLVLRRTVAVLVVVIPVLTVAGWASGTSPARCLLPCLAFTVATLAVGGFVGVRRAAIGLGSAWTVLVVAPSVLSASTPVVLEPHALHAWAAIAVVAAVVVAGHGSAFARPENS